MRKIIKFIGAWVLASTLYTWCNWNNTTVNWDVYVNANWNDISLNSYDKIDGICTIRTPDWNITVDIETSEVCFNIWQEANSIITNWDDINSTALIDYLKAQHPDYNFTLNKTDINSTLPTNIVENPNIPIENPNDDLNITNSLEELWFIEYELQNGDKIYYKFDDINKKLIIKNYSNIIDKTGLALDLLKINWVKWELYLIEEWNPMNFVFSICDNNWCYDISYKVKFD